MPTEDSSLQWKRTVGMERAADLKHHQDLSVALLQGYVEGGLIELAKGMDVGAILDEQLHDVSMAVLCGPVQSCHLQHVLCIHVGAILSQKSHFSNGHWL